MAHVFPTMIVSLVGLVSFVLALLAVNAWARTRDARLLFVAAAFTVWSLKGIVTASSLRTGVLGHETLEMAGALMDLVAVLLLILPFALRAR